MFSIQVLKFKHLLCQLNLNVIHIRFDFRFLEILRILNKWLENNYEYENDYTWKENNR